MKLQDWKRVRLRPCLTQRTEEACVSNIWISIFVSGDVCLAALQQVPAASLIRPRAARGCCSRKSARARARVTELSWWGSNCQSQKSRGDTFTRIWLIPKTLWCDFSDLEQTAWTMFSRKKKETTNKAPSASKKSNSAQNPSVRPTLLRKTKTEFSCSALGWF